MITLTVNNVDYEVNSFAQSPVWSRNRTENESDFATLVIKTKEAIDWRIYSPAEINGEQYVVQGYTEIKKGFDHYEFEVALTENIDYFTNVFPESRVFNSWVENGVVQKHTIKSILEVYEETLAYYKGIAIEWDKTDPEYNEVVEAESNDGENFKEILMKLFDRIDSIPRVERQGNVWYIYYEKYSDKNQPIDLDTGYTAQQRERNNSEYGTSMFLQAKNAIHTQPIYYPSEDGYVRARSENRIYKNSEARLDTPSNIANLDQFLVKDVIVEYFDTTYDEYYLKEEDIDITAQVVSKEKFDVIQEVGDTNEKKGQTQANTLYYTPGSTTIQHFYVADGGILDFWSQDIHIIYNAIFTAWLRENPDLEQDPTQGPTGTVQDSPEKWKLRIQYTPQRDVDLDIDRQDANNMTSSQMQSTQSGGQVDLDRFAKNQMGAINRIANQMRQNTYEIPQGDRLPQLGDYDGNWVVVYVRHTLRPQDTQTTIMATKNFNNLRAHYAINRDLSPYTITQPSVITNTVSKTYLEISKTNKYNNDIFMTPHGQKALLSFANGGFNEIGRIENSATINTSEQSANLYIETQVISSDGHITTHSQYTSKSVAGYKLDENQSFWSNKKTLIPVRYTDTEGRMERFVLNIGDGLNVSDEYNFPEVSGRVTPIIQLNNAPSYLDANGIFAHTHHISVVTDDADGIVNVRNFAKFNQLVTGNMPYLRVFTSNVPFNIFDTKVRASDISSAAGIEWDTTNYGMRLTSPIADDHWAMADDNLNILMAFNFYEGNEWVYFNFRRYREFVSDTPPLDIRYMAFVDSFGINSTMNYDTIKLRKIDIAFTTSIGINSKPQFEYRKLNVLEIPLTTTFGINSIMTYGTHKPNYVDAAYSTTFGINSSITFITGKPRYLDVVFTTSMGINSTITFDINKIYNVALTNDSGTTTGSGDYLEGDSVTIEASAGTDYTFIDWQSDYTTINGSTVNPLTFTMPSQDLSAEAIYKYYPDVTFTTTMGINSTIALYIEKPIYLDVSFATTMGINSSIALNITKPTPTYTLSVSSQTGGSATGGGTYEEGQNATIEATADTGYAFAGWSSNYATIDGNNTNPLTFSMPAQDVTATATFIQIS